MSYRRMNGKAIILSAPSGAGKTTIVKHLLENKDFKLTFSISACTRPMREGEVNGRDYHFITVDEFKSKIDDGAFIEWEEVYKNCYYGTLKAEIEKIWKTGHHVLFDVDVMGGVNLKDLFGKKALAIFVIPPSIEVLQQRLESRGTETPDKIKNRINKATLEMKFARKFDVSLLNDDLPVALNEADRLVTDFLKQPGQ
jgi:guanylate kinase